MDETERDTEVHLKWDAILTLVGALLVSAGVWIAAIRAWLAFAR